MSQFFLWRRRRTKRHLPPENNLDLYSSFVPRAELPFQMTERRFNTKRDLSWADKG